MTLFALSLVSVVASLTPDLPPPLPGNAKVPVVEEAAPPVIIGGKRADQLSDDELQEFLQSKVIQIDHPDGHVQILRVAPGYPVTLSFAEQYNSVIVGDPGLVKTEKVGRNLVLSALEREGDTSVQLLFPGNRIRVYHVIVVPDFRKGLTMVRVASFNGSEKPSPSTIGLRSDPQPLDAGSIARVIANYDALLEEKAIDAQKVRRMAIFRSNDRTGFTIYYVYRFASGLIAISFAYRNPYDFPIRYDESRLRLALGNLDYIPDYTSLHATELAAGGTTTGFTILRRTGFRLDQLWEIAWK